LIGELVPLEQGSLNARIASPAVGVSLSKVNLTRSHPTVSLSKQAEQGSLRVNLSWTSRPRAALFKRLFQPPLPEIDLDLGCLFELSNGRRGVVQALGGAFGSYNSSPFIWLDGDDRSGSSEGENLYINLEHASEIRRILVFATIYEGVPNFAQAQGVVTLTPSAGAPPIQVRLDEQAGTARTCAIAIIQRSGPSLLVQREVRFIDGTQSTLDRAYGWGITWTPGRK
jgi:tellurite resistance protein TerA